MTRVYHVTVGVVQNVGEAGLRMESFSFAVSMIVKARAGVAPPGLRAIQHPDRGVVSVQQTAGGDVGFDCLDQDPQRIAPPHGKPGDRKRGT